MQIEAKFVKLMKNRASRIGETFPKFVTYTIFLTTREGIPSLCLKIEAFFTRTIFSEDFSLSIFFYYGR